MNQGGGLKRGKTTALESLGCISQASDDIILIPSSSSVSEGPGEETSKIPSIFYSQSTVKLETPKGLIPGLRAMEP